MLPDADPKALSEVNSKVLISCMQIPVPRPPVPINPNHKVPTGENKCFGFMIKTINVMNILKKIKMGDNERKKLLNAEKKRSQKYQKNLSLKLI